MKNIFTTLLFLLCALLSQDALASAELSANGITCQAITTPASCNGTGGSAVLEVSGGVAPYTYTWSTGIFTPDLGDDLNAGIYSISITDASGCIEICTFIIDLASPEVNINCGGSAGTIAANVEFGIAPYTFNWSNGETTQEISATDGNYSVTVTDDDNCTGTDDFFYTSSTSSLNCNNNLYISLDFTGGGVVQMDAFLEGPFSECDSDLEVNLEDVTGQEILGYASDLVLDCSLIGTWNYNVRDNISGQTCSGVVNIENKLPPVVVVNNLSTALLADQEVELWAIDFDQGSYQNCGGDLRFTFSDTPPESDPNFDVASSSSSKIFGCGDYLASLNGGLTVSIFVWDDEGNFNSAFTSLVLVDDGTNPCQFAGDFVSVTTGVCNTVSNRYNLNLNGGANLENFGCLMQIPDGSIASGVNTITITDDIVSDLNGVSTLDLVMMQRGLLFGFTTELEAIAMDIDNDGAVSTVDMLDLRRLIVGINPSLGASIYKIVRADHDFGPDFNPFNMGTYQSIEFEESDLVDDRIEVSIVKNGDLNNSAFLTPESDDDVRAISLLEFDNQLLKSGESKMIDFKLSAPNQLQAASLMLKASGLEINGLDENNNDLIYVIEDQLLSLSFLNQEDITAFEFSLEVTALADVYLEDAFALSSEFANESVAGSLVANTIQLQAKESSSNNELEGLEFNIYPNPSSGYLNIVFDGNVADDKLIEIISIDGKLMMTKQTKLNKLILDFEEVALSGFYFLRVTSNGLTQIERVIIR